MTLNSGCYSTLARDMCACIRCYVVNPALAMSINMYVKFYSGHYSMPVQLYMYICHMYGPYFIIYTILYTIN